MMQRMCALLILLPLAALAEDAEVRRIDTALDAFHRAAANGDFDTYFDLLTPDAVFLGSDAGERWQGQEFRDFARPHFERGGWTYTARERRIDLAVTRDVAWFDELLDNAKYGVFRGSGVLLLDGGVWRIAQYNLSYPVPNGLLPGLAAQITSGDSPPAEAVEARVEPESEPESDQCRRKRHKTNTRAGC